MVECNYESLLSMKVWKHLVERMNEKMIESISWNYKIHLLNKEWGYLEPERWKKSKKGAQKQIQFK